MFRYNVRPEAGAAYKQWLADHTGDRSERAGWTYVGTFVDVMGCDRYDYETRWEMNGRGSVSTRPLDAETGRRLQDRLPFVEEGQVAMLQALSGVAARAHWPAPMGRASRSRQSRPPGSGRCRTSFGPRPESRAAGLLHRAGPVFLWLSLRAAQPGTGLEFLSLGTSAASVDPAHLACEQVTWRTRTPEADVVVAVVGVVVVAVRGADVVGIVVPTAAAQHLSTCPHTAAAVRSRRSAAASCLLVLLPLLHPLALPTVSVKRKQGHVITEKKATSAIVLAP